MVTCVNFADEEDLFDVKKELVLLAAKWKAVGMALRLKAGELDKIETAHPGNPEECLSDVIVEWLRKNYDVEKFGPPTWKWLVEVVADSAAGNDNALAERIAEEHPAEEERGEAGVCLLMDVVV